MDDKLEEEIRENEEALLALAESDLRSAKYAQALLEYYELDSSSSIEKPQEPTIRQDNEPQNPPEPKGSVFAY